MEMTLSERMSAVARCRVHRTPEKPLTLREVQVLEWAAQGFGNKEIARELRMEPGTVTSHLRTIMRHMNARDRAHAVAMAIRRGLIS
jgi:DNA-binding NarL/FixJ family response regulator